MNEQEMQRVLEILHPLDPETRGKVLKAVEESVDSERAAYKAAATDTCHGRRTVLPCCTTAKTEEA